MAWPDTNFNRRSFVDLAGDLSSLCLAVNEREAALAMTETLFTIQDGPATTRPTEEELTGFKLGNNGDGNKFRNTIVQVQNAAEDLVTGTARERFTTASGGEVFWTHDDLIADIGITDLTGDDDFNSNFDWWDSNVWERLRQYLDALIYVIVGPEETDTENQIRQGFENTPEAAWDSAKADTPVPNALGKIAWDVSGPVGTNSSTIDDDLEIIYDTSIYSGTVISALCAFVVSRQNLENATTVTLGDENKVFSSGGTGLPGSTEEFDAIVTVSSDTTLPAFFVTAEPADSPFTGGIIEGNGSIIASISVFTAPTDLTNDGLKFFLDLSSVVTDQ